MPVLTFQVGGVNMVMPFEDDQIISCDGKTPPDGTLPVHHEIGHIGNRSVNGVSVTAFIWTQPHDRSQPLFMHRCTECGTKVNFPRAQTRSF